MLFFPSNKARTVLNKKLLQLFVLALFQFIEELIIFGENDEILFSGVQMERRQPLPLANVDFSLCVNVKTGQGGSIVSNLPGDLRWNDESKALCVDNTGIVRFIAGQHLVCQSTSRISDNEWHEIAVVYSNEHKRYHEEILHDFYDEVIFDEARSNIWNIPQNI